jgi:hypothetical protein
LGQETPLLRRWLAGIKPMPSRLVALPASTEYEKQRFFHQELKGKDKGGVLTL